MRLEPLCGPVCLSHPRIGMPSTNTSKPPEPASDASPPVKSVRRKPNRRTYAIPKVAFRRMVQDIASEYKSDLRFQREAFDELDAPIHRVATVDAPAIYSPPVEVEQLPNPQRVIKAALEMLG